jgi:hypothetical protein
MHFALSRAYHALSGFCFALALHRHLSLKPLGGGPTPKACPDQPYSENTLVSPPIAQMYTDPLTSSHPPSLPSSVLLHTAGHVVAVLSTTDFTLRLQEGSENNR